MEKLRFVSFSPLVQKRALYAVAIPVIEAMLKLVVLVVESPLVVALHEAAHPLSDLSQL
jgi:hypothetical protein